MADGAAPPAGEPILRVTPMPADTNVYGDIFGGWLMSQMDLAAGLVASRYSSGRAVTVAVDAMQFHRPVLIGDEVSFYGAVTETGRSSMRIPVEAWRRDRYGEHVELVTEGCFVFVAIGEDRRKRAITTV